MTMKNKKNGLEKKSILMFFFLQMNTVFIQKPIHHIQMSAITFVILQVCKYLRQTNIKLSRLTIYYL